MRKFGIALALLVAAVAAYAQTPAEIWGGLYNAVRPTLVDRQAVTFQVSQAGRLSNVRVDPSAAIVCAAMSPQPTTARCLLISQTITALKAAAIWDNCDILYVLAAHADQPARLNWKNPATFLLATGGTAPTFVVDQGFMGNGVDGRLEPGWATQTHGVQFTLNSGSIWVWSRTAGTSNVGDIGRQAAAGAYIIARSAAGNMTGRLNDNDVTNQANADGSGWIGNQRVDAATKRYWRNGVQVGTDISAASTTLNSVPIWLLGASTTSFSTRQQSAAAACNSLQGKEAAFYAIMNDYMVAVGAQAFDTDAQTLINAMVPTPLTARQQLINSTVVRLKVGGVWTLLDALYLTAAANVQNASLNWVNPATFTLTASGSVAFQVDRGFTGNGVNSYNNTQFTPTTAPSPKYVQDSAHLSVWSNTPGPLNPVDMGNSQAFLQTQLVSGNVFRAQINAGVSPSNFTTPNTAGHFIGSRVDSANTTGYFNGTFLGSGAGPSQALTATAIALGGRPFGTQSFSTRQIAAGSIGASLPAAQAKAFFNALAGYMRAVGVTTVGDTP